MNTQSVQVALRIRPLSEKDKPRFSHSNDVLKTHENSVSIIPQQKTYQFDHVLDPSATQEQVYEQIASKFVDRFVDGYNVTILAYGQTSSGKTYTMGTAIDGQTDREQEGIIPRTTSALFDKIYEQQRENRTRSIVPKPSFTALAPDSAPHSGIRTLTRSFSTNLKLRPVSELPRRRASNASLSSPLSEKSTRYSILVSFIEIYNEELVDLLNFAPPSQRQPVTIREDAKNNIIWSGLKEIQVSSTEDVLKYLKMGTENRATGSTDMNKQSSRSHAIFSITLKQEKWVPAKKEEPKRGLMHRKSSLNVKELVGNMEKQKKKAVEEAGEWMSIQSKFHFVDLAGSERLKRTAAEGDRRKEGIHINAGLSALGNVISSLSDRANTHIPYRDSKLTRLLQDSLGGNSTTLMIACVSPAEIDLTETANTIKYANRASHIKNKIERNEEWCDNVEQLKQTISKLRNEIKTLKQSSYSSQSSIPSLAPHETLSTSTVETELLQSTTSLTIPEGCFDNAQLLVDLRRQIEELQNELTVTRERNVLVESELKQAEPVMREYECSITDLESQLAVARAALAHSDRTLTDQQYKINEYQSLHANETQVLDNLKQKLAHALEREKSSESYCHELQLKLEESVNSGQRDGQLLNDLRNKISMFKELDKDTEDYIHDLECRLSEATTEMLTASIQDKQVNLQILDSRLQEIERLKAELFELRATHMNELARMENSLETLKQNCADYQDQLAQETERNQALKDHISQLSQSSDSSELQRDECRALEKQLWEQEQSWKNAMCQRLEELKDSKLNLQILLQVEEKQDAIIQGLEAKLGEMDCLVSSLREQLKECNVSIDRLQADNKEKTRIAADMKSQVSKILCDVQGMSNEKKQLERILYFIESTIRLQETKSGKTMEVLSDIRQSYAAREEELEENKIKLGEMSKEKDRMEQDLRHALDRASKGNGLLKSLMNELEYTKFRLKDQEKLSRIDGDEPGVFEELIRELEEQIKAHQKTEIERKAELEQLESLLQIQLAQNEALLKTISELEDSLKAERAISSSETITKLKDRLLKLEESKLTEEEQKEILQKLSAHNDSQTSKKNACRNSIDSANATNEELIEKITQLQEDNQQLVSWNESLESQLVLQRSQSMLETKNLELELMKLSAANERLEKEIEQIAPKNSIQLNSMPHTEGPTQCTSPPITPRVSSPPFKFQRDHLIQVPRSSAYLSMSNALSDHEENTKRLSIMSYRSDSGALRPTSIRNSRTMINAGSMPPLTAPPSNPLPPVPTPLPPTPSPAFNEPTSPTLSTSPTSLYRHNSGRLSEMSFSHFNPEKYERMLQSLQRKTQNADKEMKAHQEVILKLESQLTLSESSNREAKKQLEALNREKKVYNEEIMNLRSKVDQSQDFTNERRELEQLLTIEKNLKEKAEKGRLILEERILELMTKKSKFMCF